jgi:hypothetical protein
MQRKYKLVVWGPGHVRPRPRDLRAYLLREAIRKWPSATTWRAVG